jgi:hypothetical protein
MGAAYHPAPSRRRTEYASVRRGLRRLRPTRTCETFPVCSHEHRRQPVSCKTAAATAPPWAVLPTHLDGTLIDGSSEGSGRAAQHRRGGRLKIRLQLGHESGIDNRLRLALFTNLLGAFRVHSGTCKSTDDESGPAPANQHPNTQDVEINEMQTIALQTHTNHTQDQTFWNRLKKDEVQMCFATV